MNPQSKCYSDYFDIDKEYFPVVNEELINSGQVDWRKFYPHETFIKLIETTLNVLERNQKKSIWVEGAYGTGKSYAVLTMKKILDEPTSDVEEYFEKMKISKDLLKRVEAIKEKKNPYGSQIWFFIFKLRSGFNHHRTRKYQSSTKRTSNETSQRYNT